MITNYSCFTDKKLVLMAVEDKGFYLKPAKYIQHIEDKFFRTISNATITRTIGTYNVRKKRLYLMLESKADTLLAAAHHDIHVCFNVLRICYDKAR